MKPGSVVRQPDEIPLAHDLGINAAKLVKGMQIPWSKRTGIPKVEI
jgi:hypothetical protein